MEECLSGMLSARTIRCQIYSRRIDRITIRFINHCNGKRYKGEQLIGIIENTHNFSGQVIFLEVWGLMITSPISHNSLQTPGES